MKMFRSLEVCQNWILAGLARLVEGKGSLPEMVSRLQSPRPGSVRPARSLTLFRRPRSPPHNPTICPRILVSFKNLYTCQRYSKPRFTKSNDTCGSRRRSGMFGAVINASIEDKRLPRHRGLQSGGAAPSRETPISSGSHRLGTTCATMAVSKASFLKHKVCLRLPD